MQEFDRFGGLWTDPEIKRFTRRFEALLERGLPESEAEELAERLLYRDRSGPHDTRRICLECKHLKGSSCRATHRKFEPPINVLWRCDDFQIKGS